MTMRLIPEGAVIERTYLQIPGHYGGGPEFPNTVDGWDEAVRFAQQKKADLVASLTESLGRFSTPEQIEKTANVQVRIDLRWKIKYPASAYAGGGASGMDTTVESYKDVDRLRAGSLRRPHVERAL